MRISDWSSDVCSSDLGRGSSARHRRENGDLFRPGNRSIHWRERLVYGDTQLLRLRQRFSVTVAQAAQPPYQPGDVGHPGRQGHGFGVLADLFANPGEIENVHVPRSEEHTSELQSLMRISYAVFCLTK